MNDWEDLMSEQMTPAPDVAEFTDELTDDVLQCLHRLAHRADPAVVTAGEAGQRCCRSRSRPGRR